jgi:hypothetical protein
MTSEVRESDVCVPFAKTIFIVKVGCKKIQMFKHNKIKPEGYIWILTIQSPLVPFDIFISVIYTTY